VVFGPNPIFIGMGLLMLAGCVMTRWRARIGALVILLPSLAGLAFAGGGAIYITTHPLAFYDLFGALSMLLALVALVNVLAAIGTFLEGRAGPGQAGALPPVVGAVAVLAVLLVAGLGGLARAGVSNARAAAGDVTVDASDFKFSKGSLSAPTEVRLYITNADPTFHTFTIDGAVDEQMPPNSQHRLTFTLKPGMYRYYCAVPGHAETMHGTLTAQ
jgi:plastocyanin